MRFLNIIKIGIFTLQFHLTKHARPLSVMFSVTNKCQLDCIYCKIPKRKQREMTTKEIFSLIDYFEKLGTQQINLCGGEPMMRGDIGEIISYIKKKKISISMSSNGYLIKERISEIKELDLLMLSFDGPKKIHELNKGKGTYTKLLSAIDIAIKKRINVWITTVLTKENIKYLDFVINFARKKKIKNSFQLLHLSRELSKEPYFLLPSKEIYKKAVNKIILRKKNGAPIINSYPALYNMLNWHNYKIYKLKRKNKIKCFAGKLFCYIDTDGTTYPCAHVIGNQSYKPLLNQDIKSFNFTNNNCGSCNIAANTERNLIFSFNLERLYSLFKKV